MQLINITSTPIDYKINIEPARLEMKQADNASHRMNVDPSRLSIRSRNIQVRLDFTEMQASLNLRNPGDFARYYGSKGNQSAYENIGERVQFDNQIAQIQDGAEGFAAAHNLYHLYPLRRGGYELAACGAEPGLPARRPEL